MVAGVLVANKTDLDERRVISQKAGQDFAQSKGLEYFECSAVRCSFIIISTVFPVWLLSALSSNSYTLIWDHYLMTRQKLMALGIKPSLNVLFASQEKDPKAITLESQL